MRAGCLPTHGHTNHDGKRTKRRRAWARSTSTRRPSGGTPREAFDEAVEQACHEHGHGGYTGTIGEKTGFRVVHPEPGETPGACVARHERMGTFDDKYGPAGCVELEPGRYAFFGFASS